MLDYINIIGHPFFITIFSYRFLLKKSLSNLCRSVPFELQPDLDVQNYFIQFNSINSENVRKFKMFCIYFI